MARHAGVRVVGGAYGGRSLSVPVGARPTEGKVRGALFSIWGDEIEGSRFLDLYAGSGVVGLEAAGRGALEVICVDRNPRSLRTLAANCQTLADSKVEIRRLDLPLGLRGLIEGGRLFDLIFADPPYDGCDYPSLVKAMVPLLAPLGELAVEHAPKSNLPPTLAPLTRVDERRYGGSLLSFYRQEA